MEQAKYTEHPELGEFVAEYTYFRRSRFFESGFFYFLMFFIFISFGTYFFSSDLFAAVAVFVSVVVASIWSGREHLRSFLQSDPILVYENGLIIPRGTKHHEARWAKIQSLTHHIQFNSTLFIIATKDNRKLYFHQNYHNAIDLAQHIQSKIQQIAPDVGKPHQKVEKQDSPIAPPLTDTKLGTWISDHPKEAKRDDKFSINLLAGPVFIVIGLVLTIFLEELLPLMFMYYGGLFILGDFVFRNKNTLPSLIRLYEKGLKLDVDGQAQNYLWEELKTYFKGEDGQNKVFYFITPHQRYNIDSQYHKAQILFEHIHKQIYDHKMAWRKHSNLEPSTKKFISTRQNSPSMWDVLGLGTILLLIMVPFFVLGVAPTTLWVLSIGVIFTYSYLIISGFYKDRVHVHEVRMLSDGMEAIGKKWKRDIKWSDVQAIRTGNQILALRVKEEPDLVVLVRGLSDQVIVYDWIVEEAKAVILERLIRAIESGGKAQFKQFAFTRDGIESTNSTSWEEIAQYPLDEKSAVRFGIMVEGNEWNAPLVLPLSQHFTKRYQKINLPD